MPEAVRVTKADQVQDVGTGQTVQLPFASNSFVLLTLLPGRHDPPIRNRQLDTFTTNRRNPHACPTTFIFSNSPSR